MFIDVGIGLVVWEVRLQLARRGASCAGHTPFEAYGTRSLPHTASDATIAPCSKAIPCSTPLDHHIIALIGME